MESNYWTQMVVGWLQLVTRWLQLIGQESYNNSHGHCYYKSFLLICFYIYLHIYIYIYTYIYLYQLWNFSQSRSVKGRVQKKMREKYGLLPNLPRTPPGFGLFSKKKLTPIFLLKISSTMAKTNFSKKKILT